MQLCADHPELKDRLQKQIDRLKRMAWMTADPDDNADNGVEHRQAPDSLVGQSLAGRYRIDAVVAEGGFGRVYRAYDNDLQRPVAVKVPRPDKGQSPDKLLEEARRAANLRHPHIVPVHDVGQDEGTTFIVTDLIDGKNLAEVIATSRPSPREAAHLVANIADALAFAHEQGFVHRDIKPENILIDKQGHALLTDFGLTASTEQLARGEGVRSGTLAYMAPEQLAEEVHLLIGPRTDVYGHGVVLYELLTGRLPHQARTPAALREQILLRQPATPRSITSTIPVALERIVLRCLSKHPADRFGNAAELAAALRSCPMTGPAKSRWLLPLFMLAVAILIGSGFAAKYWPALPSQKPEMPVETKPEGVFVFDGTNRIVTPLKRTAPITLEAWVRPDKDQEVVFYIGSDILGEYGLGIGSTNGRLHAQYLSHTTISSAPVPPKQWSHVAAVFGKKDTRLYLNGKHVHAAPATKTFGEAPFVIGGMGADSHVHQFSGQIRAVRISTGERFNGDFTSDEVFEKDAEEAPSRAVLICDGKHADGDRVPDLSGCGNDGVWQDASSTLPVLKKNVFMFDGKGCIVTPLERFGPVTLEAWILPIQQPQRGAFVIGSDIPSKWGIGLGLFPAVLGAEYMDGLVISQQAFLSNSWHHVAAVFSNKETRLYLDGRQVATGPASKFIGGTPFVIGQAGKNNPVDHLVGHVRCLRVSEGERFTGNFAPDEKFVKDAGDAPSRAVMIYDGAAVEGDKVIDLSGAGNHGKWMR